MNKIKTYKSGAYAAIYEIMCPASMMQASSIKKTMRQFDKSCLKPGHAFSAIEFKALREHEEVSQTVFALCMNVSKGAVSQWERGIKKPVGPTLKLLFLVQHKGLSAIT